MAITLVGTEQIGTNNNGNNVTLTFDGSPAQDDLAVVVGGHAEDRDTAEAAIVTTGYTDIIGPHNTVNLGSVASRKLMGATPDTTVEGQGDNFNQHGVGYASYMLRGVDTTTPEDVSAAQQGEQTADSVILADPPSITTQTDGAWVIVVLVMSQAHPGDVPNGAPSGYTNFQAQEATDTDRCVIATATKEVTTAGVEDPGPFQDSGADLAPQSGFFNCYTIAIRPAGAAADTSRPPSTKDRFLRQVMRG